MFIIFNYFDSIKGKIKKRNWVLQECLERIPLNADAARALLNFGLTGTDLSAAVMISQGIDWFL